jgi:diguanylate cyclase (GGDEF)-like protein
MSRLITIQGAKIALAVVAAAFMSIHVALLVIFWLNGVMPMTVFNIFSVVFYLFSLILVRKEKMLEFTVAVYLEILAHMTCAVYFVGWNCGFQNTLIGMSVLLFFAEYVGRCLQIRHVHALPWCVLGMFLYLGSFVATNAFPPPYSLPGEVTYALQIAWGVIVFGVDLFCLWAFVMLTFRSETILSTEASHDVLTGLPNRYYMSDRLEKATASENGKADEDGEAPEVGARHWLAIIDIDDFKVINDTYGHNCGDEVLKALAAILSNSIPNTEVCRWGGEEFLLLGRIEKDMPTVVELLDRLRSSAEEHSFWYDETRLHLTLTIGVAPYEAGQSTTEWINSADKNLYAGKKSGKNKVVFQGVPRLESNGPTLGSDGPLGP